MVHFIDIKMGIKEDLISRGSIIEPLPSYVAEDIINSTPPEVMNKLLSIAVWYEVGFDASEEDIRESAKSYGITYDDAIMWKGYCMRLDEEESEYKKTQGTSTSL